MMTGDVERAESTTPPNGVNLIGLMRKPYVTIRELAALTSTPESWWRERSRKNQIPGLIRFGKYCRVKLEEFEARRHELTLPDTSLKRPRNGRRRNKERP
jgi:hypothetical protein